MTGNRLRAMTSRSETGGARTRGPRIDVEFEPGANAAGEARAALAALEGRIDGATLDDIRLLVSELITNSVRHAEADRDLVVLSVTAAGERVRVEVSDGGAGFRPGERSGDLEEPGGWGLHLVDRLADRWGVETGRRTRVWFEIDR
jgi:anti-sigma regulatory factor (Ser/Thr protein kinase)